MNFRETGNGESRMICPIRDAMGATPAKFSTSVSLANRPLSIEYSGEDSWRSLNSRKRASQETSVAQTPWAKTKKIKSADLITYKNLVYQCILKAHPKFVGFDFQSPVLLH